MDNDTFINSLMI